MRILVSISAALAVTACAPPEPRLVVEHPWAAGGVWIRGDTHTHTRASDGALEMGDLVARAREQGCDVVAITDHSDRQLVAGSAEYFAMIMAARAANPGLIVIAGIEWNVPPYGGREHAALLVPDSADASATLTEFKRRFDDYDRGDESQPTVSDALEWLAERTQAEPVKPVVVYNHPSRRDEAGSENLADLVAWRAVNDLFVGFEGAPGHQGKPPIGSYRDKLPAIDRWDPAVANAGDAWDTLLQQGDDVVGALATSDFHNDNPGDLDDFLPCEFAETWFYVPERTIAGVLRAMRAGSFYGVHGHIVRALEMTATVDGLARPAMMGETVEVPDGAAVDVELRFDVPATDYAGQPNRVDAVELFVVTPSGVDVRVHAVPGGGRQSVTERVVVGGSGAVVRARVRREVADGPDLLAYTNPIRLRTR